MRRTTATLLTALCAAPFATACEDDETPFNEIDRLRVLGIRADRPWLLEGETANLDFLGVNNDPTIDDADLRTRWYFCPLQADSTVGFECVINSQEQLEALTGTASIPLLDNAVFSEFGALISTSSTAQLPFIIPAETIEQVCLSLDDLELPPFVTRPECDGRFPVTVYLEYGAVAQGGIDDTEIDPDQRIVAFRDIDLVYDTTLETNPPNNNPQIRSLSITSTVSGELVLTSPILALPLRYDRTYALRIGVDDDQAEPFETDDDDDEPRESLTVTWFIEAGETDSTRTGFLPADDDTFEDLIDNDWRTPRQVDFPDRQDIQLFLVIRDNRGGLDWLIRSFELNDETGL